MKAITPSLMNKIGRLVGADSGADIFEENGKYHYVLSSWGIDLNGDEFSTKVTSDPFPSLEALLSHHPEGLIFLREGENKVSSEYMAQRFKTADAVFQRLQDIYAEEDRKAKENNQ